MLQQNRRGSFVKRQDTDAIDETRDREKEGEADRPASRTLLNVDAASGSCKSRIKASRALAGLFAGGSFEELCSAAGMLAVCLRDAHTVVLERRRHVEFEEDIRTTEALASAGIAPDIIMCGRC